MGWVSARPSSSWRSGITRLWSGGAGQARGRAEPRPRRTRAGHTADGGGLMAITREDLVAALVTLESRSRKWQRWSGGQLELGVYEAVGTPGNCSLTLRPPAASRTSCCHGQTPENPAGASGGAPASNRDAFDRQNDEFNRQQVGMRSGKSVGGCWTRSESLQRDIQAVQDAPRAYREALPGAVGVEGTVGEVIAIAAGTPGDARRGPALGGHGRRGHHLGPTA
jgi:hypothetical protein